MYNTREEWLARMKAEMTKEMFEPKGYKVPENIKVTCGFPSKNALSRKKKRVGEIWGSQCSAGNVFETLIHPSESDPVSVAAILAHEICHAVVGVAQGHNRKSFGKAARAIGLEGSLTATYAGEELAATLKQIVARIGDYPHQKLFAISPDKKDHCRYIKIICPNEECGFYALVSRKWIEHLPTCACGSQMVQNVYTDSPSEEQERKLAANC